MRRPVATASAVVIAALGGLSLASQLALISMRSVYGQWADQMRTQGWAVHVASAKGEPGLLGASLILKELQLEGGRAVLPGGIAWKAARVELTISLLHPRTLQIAPQAEQQFTLAGGPPLVVSAATLRAQVPLGAGRPDQLVVDADQLTAGIAQGDLRQALQIGAARLELHAGSGGGHRTATTILLSARGVNLPDNGRWPLGATIGRLQTEFALSSPVLSGAAPIEQARAWRDWGGTLELRRAALHWGPLDLTLTGSLHLDQDLQPEGTGTAQLIGGEQALTALARSGTIPDGVAQTAQLMLGLIARPAAGGAGVEVPVALKHSTVSVGKLPLLSVGAVRWGGA